MDINRHIREKFRVKGEVLLPLSGWLDSNRGHLAELFYELGYKIGAEIGVAKGANALVLLQKNPGLKLFCIDPWVQFGRNSQWTLDRHFRWAQLRLAPYNAEFIKKTGMEALLDIPDNSLDFVYIDGLHDFDNAMSDLIGWSKKVHSGGIVSGHDFSYHPSLQVTQAVRGYTDGHGISPWYVTRDDSFFWVKP